MADPIFDDRDARVALRRVLQMGRVTVDTVAKALKKNNADALVTLQKLSDANLVASTVAPIPELKMFYLTRDGFLAKDQLSRDDVP